MKWLLVLLLVLAAPARAEDYMCFREEGCPARHVDFDTGELIEETFRKGDMISTDSCWQYEFSRDDGWVKIKTSAMRDQPQMLSWAPKYAGTSIYVSGVLNVRYVGPDNYGATFNPAAGTGDTMSISWHHQDAQGAVRTVRVTVERDPGQSMRSFSSEFRDAVVAMRDMYPPNSDGTSALTVAKTRATGPTSWAATASTPDVDGVLEVSWKHDPDGDGPLQPMDVTARVEKRDGESSAEAARRLKKMVDELSAVFPPNAGPSTP